MAPALPLPERLQRAILARMDRQGFNPVKLLKIDSKEIWTKAKTGQALFRLIGTSTLDALVSEAVRDYAVLQCDSVKRELVSNCLQSDRTLARVLLATGDYEDLAPCPFYGMQSPTPGDALKVYLGAYMLHAQRLAMLRLRPWFLSMYCRLAAAAVAALDTTATFRAPRNPTRVSDLPVFSSRKKSKSRKQDKNALQDISNKASSEASTASGAVSSIHYILGSRNQAESDLQENSGWALPLPFVNQIGRSRRNLKRRGVGARSSY
ncbi:hypothetical protein DFH06DRAFT_1177276 [Mycena polygramma]|nr:hypothetical protein DFH06DRAFT_1177276 [Mycena polygramma]